MKAYSLYGNLYKTLVSRLDTRRCEVESVILEKDSKTPVHIHRNLEQIFVILYGEISVKVGKKTVECTSGSVVYIPPHTWHGATALTKASYVFVSIFIGKVPKPRFELQLRSYEKKLVERQRVIDSGEG